MINCTQLQEKTILKREETNKIHKESKFTLKFRLESQSHRKMRQSLVNFKQLNNPIFQQRKLFKQHQKKRSKIGGQYSKQFISKYGRPYRSKLSKSILKRIEIKNKIVENEKTKNQFLKASFKQCLKSQDPKLYKSSLVQKKKALSERK